MKASVGEIIAFFFLLIATAIIIGWIGWIALLEGKE
jgi:hypothetical protein